MSTKDNLVERLAYHQVPLTRLGHPARIVANIHSSTLDYQMAHSNAVEVVKGIKKEVRYLSYQLGACILHYCLFMCPR